MAKDLPYFKFFVSEWNDGDITTCSMEAQGLFINVCSFYWSRLGCVGKAMAMRKYCDGNATAWKELVSAGIIKVSGDQIFINFLDEQLGERKKTSDQNAQNALKRWKKNASAMPPHDERNAKVMPIREEKRREEKEKSIALKIQASKALNLIYKVGEERGMENEGQTIDTIFAQMENEQEACDQICAMVEYKRQTGTNQPTNPMTIINNLKETDWVALLKTFSQDNNDLERIKTQPQNNGIAATSPHGFLE